MCKMFQQIRSFGLFLLYYFLINSNPMHAQWSPTAGPNGSSTIVLQVLGSSLLLGVKHSVFLDQPITVQPGFEWTMDYLHILEPSQ